jgi:hypothetical protein
LRIDFGDAEPGMFVKCDQSIIGPHSYFLGGSGRFLQRSDGTDDRAVRVLDRVCLDISLDNRAVWAFNAGFDPPHRAAGFSRLAPSACLRS